MRGILALSALLLIVAVGGLAVADAANTTTVAGNTTSTGNTTLGQVVSAAVSNPRMAFTILVEFILGVALGYVGVKAVRYLLAFIGILILGSMMSAWSLGGNLESISKQLGVQLKEFLPLLKQLAITLGATIVGPASLGVIVGIILALVKK